MASLLDLVPGVAQGKLALLGGAALLTFGTGLAAAELYEHKMPWGLGPKYHNLQKSLPARDAERFSAGGHAQFLRDQGVVENSWRPALQACEASRRTASGDAAARLDQELTQSHTTNNAAYALGLAVCRGKTNASNSTSRPAAPVGVRGDDTDLGDIVRQSSGGAPTQGGVPARGSTGLTGRPGAP